MKNKKLIRIIFYVAIGIVLILPTKTKAVLQANGGTPAKYHTEDWMKSIRQMQVSGGALGLTDTINGTNLTSGNKNLDIHMEKNTEYGAMILLSASSYGKPDKINDGETTTGNKTGIEMRISGERVVATQEYTQLKVIKNASARYKNMYPNGNNYTEKKGDASGVTASWHNTNPKNTWLDTNGTSAYNVIKRSILGSIFSQQGQMADGGRDAPGYAIDMAPTRAVVVCGSGV